LKDDGFYINDSNAISAYLVSKYGNDDYLYPKDLQKRAIIDQRVHYNSSVVSSTVYKTLDLFLITDFQKIADFLP